MTMAGVPSGRPQGLGLRTECRKRWTGLDLDQGIHGGVKGLEQIGFWSPSGGESADKKLTTPWKARDFR
jgi:hypothetical protein